MTKWRFLHPLDSIRDALVKPSAAAKEQEHCLMGIDTIYHTVAQLKAPFIDPANLQALMIDVLPLLEEGQNEMGMCMVFFRPWPVARLRMHPILLSNPEVARAVRISMEGMDHGPPSLQRYGFPLDSRVRILANAFVHHVQSRPRSAPDGQVHESLASITGWVHHEGYTPQFEADTASDPEWACNGGWTQPGDGNDDGAGDEKTPHIKAVMFSVIDGDVDGGGGEERLLRGEVLTILGIIAERLRIESLKRRGHLVIPVMLFSFMGPRHGRILVAVFNGAKLVIQKSALHMFTSHDEKSMEIFARYQATDVGPGDTTRLRTMNRRRSRLDRSSLVLFRMFIDR